MSRNNFEGLAGEPGFQLGTFLENHYGVPEAHILDDEVSAIIIGSTLSRFELIGVPMPDDQAFASLHDTYRARGILPPSLQDQATFLRRMHTLLDPLPEGEVPRRLQLPPMQAAAPAKQRAFVRATAGLFIDAAERHKDVQKALGAPTFYASGKPGTNTRAIASRQGAYVGLPDNNHCVAAYTPGVAGARQRIIECRDGVWDAAYLVDDNMFARGVCRLYAWRQRTQDRVTAYDGGTEEGTAELVRTMAYDQTTHALGFDALLLTGLHVMEEASAEIALRRAPDILGEQGVLVVAGVDRPVGAIQGTSVWEVITEARKLFGDPYSVAPFEVSQFGKVAPGHQAAFVKP